MGYAFISYSTKNQASADAIKALLNKNNIDTWMAPNDIPVGSKYAQVITQALKDCTCLILLLSSDAQKSTWVAKEVERAINYKKTKYNIFELTNTSLLCKRYPNPFSGSPKHKAQCASLHWGSN